MAERILIISASMGAGHDGAARELAHRLEASGHPTQTLDFLSLLPLAGRWLKRAYQFQLDHAPWSYEALYQLFFRVERLHRPLTRLVAALSGRRLLKWVEAFGADCIVTTYPLASLLLGRLRQGSKLTIPTATFVTDFAVHPLWVHRGVDANFCVHPSAARTAEQATAKPSMAPGPMVPDRFFGSDHHNRDSIRASMGIPTDANAVLVVAGSWGVGDLERSLEDLLAIGGLFPVVVCGSNTSLRDRLQEKVLSSGSRALVLGWTDSMHELMSACNVLLQNAGGLTCMEAFAAGLPVVSYRPIPGHGVMNAEAMDAAGVAPFVRESSQLAAALERSTTLAGRATVRRASAMFVADAADEIARFASRPAPEPSISWPSRIVRSRVAVSVAVMASVYAGFTWGADAAVAHGIDVASAPKGADALYVGVRLNRATLDDPSTAPLLARAHVSAVVPGTLAAADPSGVAALASAGVPIANGGWQGRDDTLDLVVPHTGVARAARAISSDTGRAPSDYVPSSGVNGFDLSAARLWHEPVVSARVHLDAGATSITAKAGVTYLILADGSLTHLTATLDSIADGAAYRNLAVQPFSSLR